MKKAAALFILTLAFLAVLAFAGTDLFAREDAWVPEDMSARLSSFRNDRLDEEWFGKTLEVFYAPFDDASRPEEGTVTLDGDVMLMADESGGKWSMIDYPLSGGARRIAWAKISVYDAFTDSFPYDNAPCRLTRDADLTDDPFGQAGKILRLKKGTTVIALCFVGRERFDGYGYNGGGALADAAGGWAYVQTEIDGSTAWLFIPEDALAPEPLWTIDETGVLTVREGVTRIGANHFDYTLDETEFAAVRKDDIAIPRLSRGHTIPPNVRAIVLPSTLRTMGVGAIDGGSSNIEPYDYIYIPSVEECGRDTAIDFLYARKIIFGSGVRVVDRFLHGWGMFVDAWEVEEGNPDYISVDGVLFSADGKTLIAYPNGSPALHYTVPDGVEEIADRAFYDSGLGIELHTISLPMGLKRIGDNAFSGCGRLISLTVPLTVTDISKNAFEGCVSLERLSLPPGLETVPDTPGEGQADFSVYNGDNGTTLPCPTPDPWAWEEEEEYEDDDSFAVGHLAITEGGV